MSTVKNFEEWRAEEIAKLFLLKSGFKMAIENYPTPLLDFFIVLKDKPDVKFAVEVKTNKSFNLRIKKQVEQLKIYRDAGMLTIPVLIFKINDEAETGELDFLVIPSFSEKKLLIRNDFKFSTLNNDNFTSKMSSILKWYNKKNE
jgi:hypothetical protein